MSKIVKLNEQDLIRIVNKVINENEINEGPLDSLKNVYRGVKGIKRGYGYDFFKNVSKLEQLIMKLKKLDVPNEQVMKELNNLKNNVNSLNIPSQRKQTLINLIDNSIYHFNQYSNMNDRILAKIKTLNLDSWK